MNNMSTRSNIKLIDQFGEILLYKHHDGYPEGGPGVISFLRNKLEKNSESAEELANELIKNSEVRVSSGIHGDIEWYYEVDMVKKKIDVFETSWDSDDREFIGSHPFVKEVTA